MPRGSTSSPTFAMIPDRKAPKQAYVLFVFAVVLIIFGIAELQQGDAPHLLVVGTLGFIYTGVRILLRR